MSSVEWFEGADSEWDEFASRSAGTHCHRLGWRRIMEDVLGQRYLPLAVRRPDGALAGLLPLVSMRSRILGHYLVSVPYLNYGGPLGSPEAIQMLTAEACRVAREMGATRLELRSRTELNVGLTPSLHKVTSILALPSTGAESLFRSFPAKLRSQLRRAERESTRVSFGRAEVSSFHTVFSSHMTDLGTPTYGLKFFEAVADEFGDDAWVGCVYLNEEPVAAGFALRWGDEVEMTWASALKRFSRFAPNMLLYWSFLQRAAESGVARLDFGRSTRNGGTHRFKQQWGTTEAPLWWYGYSQSGGSGSTSSDLSSAAWASVLWKRLPVSVARVLGPPIRRRIPL